MGTQCDKALAELTWASCEGNAELSEPRKPRFWRIEYLEKRGMACDGIATRRRSSKEDE
jgi:hypothetical protein